MGPGVCGRGYRREFLSHQSGPLGGINNSPCEKSGLGSALLSPAVMFKEMVSLISFRRYGNLFFLIIRKNLRS